MHLNFEQLFLLKVPVLTLVLSASLSACGGGGGGGNTTPPTTVTPPPTPPPAPSVADEFPDSFSLELPEGDAFQSVQTNVFQITAPSTTDDVTASVTQIGDGQFFAVAVLASDPNASGVRDVRLEFTSTADLDFEMPADANGDNVYSFEVTGTYQQESLSATISISITDVVEPAMLTPRIIQGSFPGQRIGDQIVSLELENSFFPEVALPFSNGSVGEIGAILNDGFLADQDSDVATLENSADYGTLFLDSMDSQASQNNKITAAGRKLLVSEELKNRLTLFEIQSDADRAALSGDVDLIVEQSNRAVYAFDDGDNPVGRVIPDTNGDGIEDIFVFKNTDPAFSDRELGIIYGTPSITPDNADRTGDFDLTLSYTSTLDGFIIDIIPHVVDLDGDNVDELLIISPGYTDDNGRASGRMWVLKSDVLRDGVTTSLNLDALAPEQGASLSGSGNPQYEIQGREDLGIGNSLIIGPDFDQDGGRRILFTDRNGAFYSIDGDELLSFNNATLDNFFEAGGYRLSDFSGFSLPAETIGAAYDSDVDFITDFLITDQSMGRARIISSADIAQSVQTAADTPDLVETPIGEASLLTIDLSALANPNFSGSKPLYSRRSGLVGRFVFADSDANDNRGRLIVVEESDLLQLTDPALTDTPVDTIILTEP